MDAFQYVGVTREEEHAVKPCHGARCVMHTGAAMQADVMHGVPDAHAATCVNTDEAMLRR